jgi:hypothetical protein
MKLSFDDGALFFRVSWHLLFYVSRQLELLPRIAGPDEMAHLADETGRRLREGLYKHPQLFDQFAGENPFGFGPDELAVARSWRQFIKGRFIVWRYLKQCTVFLDEGRPVRAVGVLALSKTFEEMLGPGLPVMVESVLLPLRDKIVYDGQFASCAVRFGPGLRQAMNDAYREAKRRDGVITSFATLRARLGSEPAQARTVLD